MPTKNIPEFAPKTMDGIDLNSTYHVIARTETGYIGVRRMSKYCFKIKAERFDRYPILKAGDEMIMGALVNTGFAINDEGRRISGVFIGEKKTLQGTDMLLYCLLRHGVDLKSLPSANVDHYVEVDKKIEAKNDQKEEPKEEKDVVYVPPKTGSGVN